MHIIALIQGSTSNVR